MRWGGAGLLACAALLGAAGAVAALERVDATTAKPSHIVSLNMCTDELLLRLVDPARIASVTWLSQDTRGANMAEIAGTVPANHGLAEEVLTARPDLVLAGRYTTRTTVALLRRVGMPLVEFGVAADIAGVATQVREVAAAVGEPARGEAIVAGMERRLAALPPAPSGARPGAFVLRPNGFTAGRGSLVDDILTRAGLDNLAAGLDLGGYGQVPLETVILENASVLVVDDTRTGPPSLATAVLDHPALTKLRRRLIAARVPSRLWTCAGPSVVDAVEQLKDAVAAMDGATR